MDIERGEFSPERNVTHTHEGSIGNLCTAEIAALMEETLGNFGFDRVEHAERSLLEE